MSSIHSSCHSSTLCISLRLQAQNEEVSNPWFSPISNRPELLQHEPCQQAQACSVIDMVQLGGRLPVLHETPPGDDEPCHSLPGNNPFSPSDPYRSSLPSSSPLGSEENKTVVGNVKARMPDFLKQHARSRRSTNGSAIKIATSSAPLCDPVLKSSHGENGNEEGNPFAPMAYEERKPALNNSQITEKLTEAAEVGVFDGSARPAEGSQNPFSSSFDVHGLGIRKHTDSDASAIESPRPEALAHQALSSPASPGFPASLFVARRHHAESREDIMTSCQHVSAGGAVSRAPHVQQPELHPRSISQPGGVGSDCVEAEDHRESKGWGGEELENSSLYQLD